MSYVFHHDLKPCPCGKCRESILVVDENPRFPDADENNLLTLRMPAAATMNEAFFFGSEAKAKRHRGEALTGEEEVIIGLLDAFLAHRETLLRIVVHGVEGTGDAEHDAAEFDRAIELAHDLACASFYAPTKGEGPMPAMVQIDTTLAYSEMDDFIAESFDGDDCIGDGCDDPDCDLHNDKPVPTTFEA